MSKIAKDLPLSEITLRRYEKPADMHGRELARRLCLSFGLLQPGDSRDVIVDIFLVLLNAKKNREELDSETIRQRVIDLRTGFSLPLLGIAHSNIRRQLKRLKDIMLVEVIVNKYRITEFMPLADIYKEKIEGYLIHSITDRVKEYVSVMDSRC